MAPKGKKKPKFIPSPFDDLGMDLPGVNVPKAQKFDGNVPESPENGLNKAGPGPSLSAEGADLAHEGQPLIEQFDRSSETSPISGVSAYHRPSGEDEPVATPVAPPETTGPQGPVEALAAAVAAKDMDAVRRISGLILPAVPIQYSKNLDLDPNTGGYHVGNSENLTDEDMTAIASFIVQYRTAKSARDRALMYATHAFDSELSEGVQIRMTKIDQANAQANTLLSGTFNLQASVALRRIDAEIAAERFRIQALVDFQAQAGLRQIDYNNDVALLTLGKLLDNASIVEIELIRTQIAKDFETFLIDNDLEKEMGLDKYRTIELNEADANEREDRLKTKNSLIADAQRVRAMEPGDAQLFAAQEMVTKLRGIPLPSEIRWDSTTGTFVNAPGFESRHRSAETMEYLREVKPLFEHLNSMKVAIQISHELNTALHSTQATVDAEAANFRAQMSTGDIDSAEEALAKQRVAETALAVAQEKLVPIRLLMELMANPTVLALARHYGLLGTIEDAIGMKIPFGKGVTAGSPGSVPSQSEWIAMSDGDRTAAFLDWQAITGKSQADFNTLRLQQTPGGPVAGTRFGG